MPSAFVGPIDATSTKSNNGAIDLPLIGISRTASADQVNSDHLPQPLCISRP